MRQLIAKKNVSRNVFEKVYEKTGHVFETLRGTHQQGRHPPVGSNDSSGSPKKCLEGRLLSELSAEVLVCLSTIEACN